MEEIKVKELNIKPRREEGRRLSRKTVGPDKITGSLDANSVSTASVQNLAITQAKLANFSVGQAQLKYASVSVSIANGQATGTATVASGDITIGYVPTSLDQVVKTISISGTTLTCTLNAATGLNPATLSVVVLHT